MSEFKVGDMIVSDMDMHIYKIRSMCDSEVLIDGSWWSYRLISRDLSRVIRLATPKEIEQGFRDE